MDYASFFGRHAEKVAEELVGKQIARASKEGPIYGTIIATGAYEGGKETSSRKGMLYAPGTLFLMPFRGHNLLNIATYKENFPSCVEIRGIAVPNKKILGSGAVSNFLHIDSNLDGVLIGEDIKIIENPDMPAFKIEIRKGKSDNCQHYFLLKKDKLMERILEDIILEE